MKQEHKNNLIKVALNLLFSKPVAIFNMAVFQHTSPCGTIACFAGHGLLFGIKKRPGEFFYQYILRVFGVETSDHVAEFLFGTAWSHIDNTPESAAKRALYYVENEQLPLNDRPLEDLPGKYILIKEMMNAVNGWWESEGKFVYTPSLLETPMLEEAY